MKKYFVNYYIAGSFFQERKIVEVKEKDITKFDLPLWTFGFELITKEKSVSGKFKMIEKEIYYIGRTLTLDDVETLYNGKNTPAYRNVLNNATKNETAFYGIAHNLQIIPKSAFIIDPHTLPQIKKETLAAYDNKLSAINKNLKKETFIDNDSRMQR